MGFNIGDNKAICGFRSNRPVVSWDISAIDVARKGYGGHSLPNVFDNYR